MAIEAGQMLGHCRLVEKIGEGGMGVVWRGFDTTLDREIAIKVLPDRLAGNAERLSRFEREAKAVAALNHPNIVTLHSVERDGDVRFITMELIRGKPLREMIPRNGMPVNQLVSIARPLVNALVRAHSQGITHRDLKPDNVMIDEDGRLKILDFGLAKISGSPAGAGNSEALTATSTGAGILLGTAHYMSPEQAQGEAADERSDIFAVGVMLFEMATGRRPFRGKNPMSVLSAILKDPAPAISDVKPLYPRDLGRIVQRCLEKNPERRYQKATSLSAELDNLAHEIGKAAPAAGAASAARARRFLTVAAALALIAATVTILALRDRSDPVAEAAALLPGVKLASVAVIPFVNVGGGDENEYFSDGMTDELINALGRVQGLRVPARTTVFTLKGADLTVQEWGQRLGVDHVLEGTVRKAGDRLKVSTQLIHAGDDFEVWSGSYERGFEDVFAIQEEIARSIVSSLEVRLVGRVETELVHRSTDDIEAYNLYLQARFLWNKRMEADLLESIRLYEKAIRRDPGYAEAYAGLAWSYGHLASNYLRPRDAMPQARVAGLKAVQLDDSLADGHAALGFVHLFYDWDWEAARQRALRVVELDPNNADGHLLYGTLLASQGEFERSVPELLRAEELDPLSPGRKWEIGIALMMAGEYELALQVGYRAIALREDFANAHAVIGFTAPLLGDYETAIRHSERAYQLDPYPQNLELVLTNYAYSGQMEKARAGLGDLLAMVRERYTCPYEVARVYVALEEPDRAIEWFEKAIVERSDCWVWGKVDPRMDGMRKDDRYVDQLRRVGHSLD